jgi:hypothetical protein
MNIAGTISSFTRSLLRNAGIEKMPTIRIRALVFQERDFWIAQCLEHDIAVQSHSKDDLVVELGDVLVAYVQLAIDEGKVPLADIPQAPRQFFEMFARSDEWKQEPGIKTLDDAPQIVPTLRVFHPQHA